MSSGGESDSVAAIACDRVSKRYGRVSALRSVSFALQPGECLALFGRNGAGKTTLLHILASLIRSYEGEAHVFGANLRGGDDNARRPIGLVSHETYLYNDLTVLDNLRFYARLYAIDGASSRITCLLQQFDLESKTHSSARDLSRGMKQRLSLARALLHQPRLLLLDEPFTGLDEPSCQSVATMLGDFTAGGGSILITTHDIERGLSVATRVAVLERGSIAHDATAEGLDANAFRETYGELMARA